MRQRRKDPAEGAQEAAAGVAQAGMDTADRRSCAGTHTAGARIPPRAMATSSGWVLLITAVMSARRSRRSRRWCTAVAAASATAASWVSSEESWRRCRPVSSTTGTSRRVSPRPRSCGGSSRSPASKGPCCSPGGLVPLQVVAALLDRRGVALGRLLPAPCEVVRLSEGLPLVPAARFM